MDNTKRALGHYHVKHYGEETVAKWDGNYWTFAGIETFFKDSEFDEIGPAVSRDSDVVEFMQWVLDSNFVPTKGVSGWVFMDMLTGKKSDQYTAKQLYESFKASKP